MGDITFEDWYDTPVFDTELDERFEQLATSRRAPVRLVGAALLRLAPAPRQKTEPAAAPIDLREESDLREEKAPAAPAAMRTPWRQRAARLLDRWADAEVASQARLEELVLPRRWRG